MGYAAKPLVDSSSSGVRLPSAGTKGGLEAAGIDNKGKGKGKQVAEELPWLKTAVTLDKKASIRWADWADGQLPRLFSLCLQVKTNVVPERLTKA